VVVERSVVVPISGRFLGSSNGTRAVRRRRAIRVFVAVHLAFSFVGCSSKSTLSADEAIRQAKECINPDPTIRYLPAARPDLQECFKKAMRAPAGRRFLLDDGNSALAAWSAEVAKYVGDVVAGRPESRVRDAAGPFRSSPVATEASPRMGDFYRQLVVGAFAHSKDRRTMAAEVAGILRSFVSQGSGKPAEPYIRWARERLPDGDDDEVNRELADIVHDGMEQLTALSLWADERVRNALFAADPPDMPATPPPAATPLLEDPPGQLHIPGPDQEPAHSIFFKWYEHEGGLPLRAAAGGFVQMSGILEKFLR
jgi:hypothetical protein